MKRKQVMENHGISVKLCGQDAVLENLRKEVQKLCPEGVKVEIEEMERNNGVVKQGMMIGEKSSKMSPVIYLEAYLEEIEHKNHSIEEIASTIYAIYQNHRREEVDLAEVFQNVALVKERIVYRLVSLEKNREYLTCMPHRIVGEDLAVVFALLWEKDSFGMMTIKVKDEYMHFWGISEEELWNLATINTPKLFPVIMERIEDVLIRILKKQLEAEGIVFDEDAWNRQLEVHARQIKEKKNMKCQVYVLSNACKTWGASAILYPEVLKELSKKLGGDLLILPSSVHEVIITRWDNGADYDKMAEMVKEINQIEVLPEEILSDSVYLYRSEDDSLCRVAGNGKESAG